MPATIHSPPTPRPTLATAAFAHASAVLVSGPAAVQAATIALRRGGRSRSTVLGHARDAALALAGDACVDLAITAPADLVELARALTFTRPPLERAIVDLAGRHHLDQRDLGRALGLPPAEATARVAEVGETWQRELDPALLAHLGPGSCEELAAALESHRQEPATAAGDEVDGDDTDEPQPTLGDVTAAGAIVASHATSCDACRDRLRAMVSVRTLVSNIALEHAPAEVELAAAGSRARAGSAPPPLVAVRNLARRRWSVAAITGAVIAVAIAGGIVAGSDDQPTEAMRVDDLTKLPAAGTRLSATPDVVEGTQRSVQLRNMHDSALRWEATADQRWVIVTPASGTLDGQRGRTVRVGVTPDAPEGDVRASITFTGDDGSTAIVRVQSDVDHEPDVAAERDGCSVTAQVEDESELRSVELHWSDGAAQEAAAMADDGVTGIWSGTLPPGAGTWWVSATDALGNTARTAPEARPTTCP